MQDLIGRTIGHYRIVEKIGAGGMGEVYRATDERLDRDVAIKVLPFEVANDEARLARFEREAKAVAALSHSNILEIFDFNTDGNVTYAVTELLKGHTLRHHLRITGGPIPWKQVQEIGQAVANGLGAAHAKNVVHRDVKPANIFICSDGRIKILDFGLAAIHKVVDIEAETDSIETPLTREGSVMGTVGYMAPEQVRGEPADPRTDIFSLGCVLYEMLTGTRIFKRDTTAEIMTAILREEPRSFTELGVEVAPDAESTVLRCLEKNPDHRFQSASDLAFAIGKNSHSAPVSVDQKTAHSSRKWWFAFGGAAVVVAAFVAGVWFTREKPSIDVGDLDQKKVVVSVFENRTGDASLNVIGALIPEALSEGASEIGDFSVVPSLTALGGQSADDDLTSGSQALRGPAGETRSGLVVSGTYYLMGDDLRFQAQLMDMTRGEIVYSAPAVTGSRDSPGVVIEALRQKVLGAVAWYFVRDDFRMSTPPLLAAYMEYLESKEGDEESESRHLRKATELDPSFYHGWWLQMATYARNRQCDLHALVLDEMEANLTRFTSLERLDYRGLRAYQIGDWRTDLAVAREKDIMTDGGNKYWVGVCSIKLNEPRSAIAAFSRIPDHTSLNPRGSWGFFWLGRALHMLGEYQQELEVADRYLEFYPSDFFLFGRKVAALAAMGRLGEIDSVIEEVALVSGGWLTVMDTMVRAAGELRAHGYRDEALLMAKRAVTWWKAQPESEQSGLRPFLVDSLILAENWHEAKTVADALLEKLESSDGPIEEEGGRSRGGVWWGDGSLVVSLGRVGTLAARLGNHDEAHRIADRLRDFDGFCSARNRTYERACIAAQLGENDEAVELLKKAVSQGYWGFWGMGIDPNLDPLRDDPKFVELMRPKG